MTALKASYKMQLCLMDSGKDSTGMFHHLYSSLKSLSLFITLFSLTGCAVVPKYAEQDVPQSCDLYTKKLDLEVEILGKKGLKPLSNCSGEACIGILGVSAGIFAGSAVVSGSIYLVGNTLHWLEKKSRCSDEEASAQSKYYEDILQAAGGEKITSPEELAEEMNLPD